MKRYLLFVFVMLFCVDALLAQKDYSLPVDITEENFPDENFRKFLNAKYAGGEITTSNIGDNLNWDFNYFKGALTENSETISNWEGIQYFKDVLKVFRPESFSTASKVEMSGFSKLTDFYITKNDNNVSNEYLETVDLSDCPNLTTMSAFGCKKLTSFNISCDGESKLNKVEIYNCPILTTLTMPDEYPLGTLKIEKCSSLESLDLKKIKDREFTINAMYCTNLKEIKGLSGTNITKIEAKECKSLESLDFSNCPKLKTVEAWDCIKLKSVNLSSSNLLNKLELFRDTELESVILPEEYPLKTLNMYNCPNLTSVDLNKITGEASINISGCTNLESALDFSNTNLKSILAYSTNITSLDVSNCPKLTTVSAYSCPKLSKVDASYNGKSALNKFEVQESPILEAVYLPDEYTLSNEFKVFNCPLKTLYMNKMDGKVKINVGGCTDLEILDLSECPNITEIATMAGNTSCPNLVSVKLSTETMPNLTKIDMPDLPKLTELYLKGAINLQSIKINNNPQLITGLTLPETMSELTSFEAHSCNLQPSLDFSGSPKLTTVDVSVNRLTALKLPANVIISGGNAVQNFGAELVTIVEDGADYFCIEVAPDFDYSNVSEIRINQEVQDLNNHRIIEQNGVKYLVVTNDEQKAKNFQEKNEIFRYWYKTGAAEGSIDKVEPMNVNITMCPTLFWEGFNSNWDDANNWSPEQRVPFATDAVYIIKRKVGKDENYYMPIINGNAVARVMKITNGNTVTINPGATLTVKAVKIKDATDVAATGGKLYTEPGSYVVLHADTDVEDEKNANRTVGGYFYAEMLTNSNTEITNECNVKVQRYFRYKKFDRFSVPVYGANSTTVQGSYSYNPYLYTYDESYCFTEKYPKIFDEDNNAADSVSKYLGVAWKTVSGSLYAPRHVFNPTVGYNFYSFQKNHVAEFTGTTKSEMTTINLTYTNNDDGKKGDLPTDHKATNGLDGWNFVGNPFTVPVDWVNVTKTGINGSVYIFDNDDNKYYVCNSDGQTNTIKSGVSETIDNSAHNPRYILPTQGFFVRANSTNANIVVKYENVTVDKTSILKDKKQSNDVIKLLLNNDTDFDITTIYFRDGASEGYDNSYDAYKLQSGTCDIYSVALQGKYSINALDSKTDSTVVKLGYGVSNAGNYTLTAAEFNINTGNVYLVDSLLNTTVNILEEKTYSFDTEEGTFDNRFYLVFSNMNPIVETPEEPNDKDDAETIEVVESETENVDSIETPESEVVEPQIIDNYKQDGLLPEIEDNNNSVEQKNVTPNNIKIWPNPTTEVLNISANENSKFLIYDYSGKLCMSGILLSNNSQINISDLKSGLYIIKINNKTIKFIKQ